ncbi:MAG: hypothetical protein P0119_04450 [Nitrospira sp.]|nr:hypothetical protein [Nitrospira sp.]
MIAKIVASAIARFLSRLCFKTARLWRCVICRPVDELATELQKAIGRELTDTERRRFGVPEALLTKR